MITQPVLVAIGSAGVATCPGMSGLAADFFARAADAICKCVPHAERAVIEGVGHMIEAQAVAPVLARFFAGDEARGAAQG